MSSDQEEYTTKVFKSGNSAALRLPKALGIAEGTKVRMVRESKSTFRVEAIKPLGKKIDISGFAGKLPGFKPAPREEFEERPSAIARRKALSGE
jgi:antitoxin VapB